MLAHWASYLEKLLAQSQNLLVLENRTRLLLSPELLARKQPDTFQ